MSHNGAINPWGQINTNYQRGPPFIKAMTRLSMNTCCSSLSSRSVCLTPTSSKWTSSRHHEALCPCVYVCVQLSNALSADLPQLVPPKWLTLSPTFSPPSQPGAPSNRPLLRWLDFSLVKSRRLGVTSSRSLPTDYILSLYPTSSSSSPSWRMDGTALRWSVLLHLKSNLTGSGWLGSLRGGGALLHNGVQQGKLWFVCFFLLLLKDFFQMTLQGCFSLLFFPKHNSACFPAVQEKCWRGAVVVGKRQEK